MQAHRSAHRYFHPINLGRLDYDARFEIIDRAAEVLGIEVDDTTRTRIARISDGFPHYIHLISEKLFWRVFSAKNDGRTTGDLFEQALQDASDAMEPELKVPYETAMRKYTNDYEWILFAAADGHELQKRSTDIYYGSYKRIMESVNQTPLSRDKFNARINNLKRPGCAEILTGTRQGWYEYREVIRGYARLRAEQKGITLEIEHPLQKRRYGVAHNEGEE
jgi:hypothetical protein